MQQQPKSLQALEEDQLQLALRLSELENHPTFQESRSEGVSQTRGNNGFQWSEPNSSDTGYPAIALQRLPRAAIGTQYQQSSQYASTHEGIATQNLLDMPQPPPSYGDVIGNRVRTAPTGHHSYLPTPSPSPVSPRASRNPYYFPF